MLLKILWIGFTSCRIDDSKQAPTTACLAQMLISQIPHDGLLYSLLYSVLFVYAKTRSSAFDVSFDEIAKEFISEKQREGLRKLLNFDFRRDKNYNLPAERLKILCRFIRSRAGELLKF